MQTQNTIHITSCSIQGCLSDALITVACPPNAVRGYCSDHLHLCALDKAKDRERAAEQQLDNEIEKWYKAVVKQ